jgi:hypothetical protein
MIGPPRTSTVLLHAAEAARRNGVSLASLRRWMAERAGRSAVEK